MPEYFQYGPQKIDYLKSRDSILAAAIDRIGYVYREVNPLVFEALLRRIVVQQISAKAATTVFSRVLGGRSIGRPRTVKPSAIFRPGKSTQTSAFQYQGRLGAVLARPAMQRLPCRSRCRVQIELLAIGIAAGRIAIEVLVNRESRNTSIRRF
ncbi:MAG: hypothetical protein LBJ08_02490 [Bifidobacteriaceae bacterium]|jgi:hypothetical protein|nr:hypothetical protein [Bifidobacteriaceae bacterium]